MKLLLINFVYWIPSLVSGNSCIHPGFLIPKKEDGAILKVHKTVQVSISCKLSVQEGNSTGTSEGQTTYTNGIIECCNISSTKSYGSYNLTSQKPVPYYPNVNVSFKEVDVSESSKNENTLYLNRSRDEIALFEYVYVYRLRDSLNIPLDYAFLMKDLKENKGFIVNFSRQNKTTFYETDMKNTTIAFGNKTGYNEPSAKNIDLNDLQKTFVIKQLAFYQMWLKCKFNNAKTTQLEEDAILDLIFYKYLIIIWSFSLCMVTLFIVNVTVNFITLCRLKQVSKRSNRYLWCCLNQGLSVAVVCDTFRNGNQLIQGQLYELLNILQNRKKEMIASQYDEADDTYEYVSSELTHKHRTENY